MVREVGRRELKVGGGGGIEEGGTCIYLHVQIHNTHNMVE